MYFWPVNHVENLLCDNECSHTLKWRPEKIVFQPNFGLKNVSMCSEKTYDCVGSIKLGLGRLKTHFFHKMLNYENMKAFTHLGQARPIEAKMIL